MNRFVYIKDNCKINGYNIKKYEIAMVVNKVKDIYILRFVNIEEDLQVAVSMTEAFDIKDTGDQFEKKVCNMCNRLLDVSNFAKNQNGINNRTVRRPSCNECRKLIDGKDLSLKDKKEWNKTKPNLIIWECPICKKRTIPGLTSKVVLDHDHKSGKPRAWICDSCNTGLGRFKDDTETIENAIKYLKATNKNDGNN